MLNKIMLIGNLGKDPEMNDTPSGMAVTKFPLAVSRYKKSNTGERQEETDWFNIVAWGKRAETCNTYLHKGSKVYIEGRLTQRKYTDKNGLERTSVEVQATDMEMLDSKPASSGSESYSGASAGGNNDPFLPDYPDDLS